MDEQMPLIVVPMDLESCEGTHNPYWFVSVAIANGLSPSTRTNSSSSAVAQSGTINTFDALSMSFVDRVVAVSSRHSVDDELMYVGDCQGVPMQPVLDSALRLAGRSVRLSSLIVRTAATALYHAQCDSSPALVQVRTARFSSAVPV